MKLNLSMHFHVHVFSMVDLDILTRVEYIIRYKDN